jgi:hypothetical protein
MKLFKKYRCALLMLFLLCTPHDGRAQDNSWIVTIAAGDTLSQCALLSLEGDSLRVLWCGFPVSLPVESVTKLQYHRKSEFWRGAFFGASAGSLAGTIVSGSGYGSDPSGPTLSILGVVSGFTIGGLAAEYFSSDDHYDFLKMSTAEKRSFLTSLLYRSPAAFEGDQPK